MGVIKAQTTTLGIRLLRMMLDSSQTVIWLFMEGPIKDRAFREIRLSRPIPLQGTVKKPEPRIRIMLSEKYWAMMVFMGMTSKRALATMGTKAVTVILTGRDTHQ